MTHVRRYSVPFTISEIEAAIAHCRRRSTSDADFARSTVASTLARLYGSVIANRYGVIAEHELDEVQRDALRLLTEAATQDVN
jgi:phage terminase Nu1 subunit (DNA packaging protein)